MVRPASWALACLLLPACAATGSGEEGGFAFTDDELDTVDRIDAYREDQGLSALETDPLLGELARAHSEAMLAGDVPFSHDGFDTRAGEMQDAGYVSASENVAVNAGFDDPVGTAVQGWLESEGHHDNIIGDWTHTGVGIATDGEQFYFTQLFGSLPE